MTNKALDIAPPFLIGLAVDVVVNRETSFLGRFGVEDPRRQLVVLAILTFVVWALESVFEYLHGVEWRNLAQTIQHELRIDAYRHIQHLEIAYHEDQSTGELMSILNDDVNQLERFLDHGANEVLQTATATVLIGATFLVLTPEVAWLSFLPIPIIIWGSIRFQRTMEVRYAAVRRQAGAVNSQLANNLAGILTIKAFTAEDRETERIAAESDRYRTANRRAIALSAAFSPLIRVAVLVGFTATLVWGGFRALDGSLAVGGYSVMVFLTQRLLWPLTRLGETLDLYQRAMASTNRILAVLDTPPSLVDGIEPLGAVTGGVSFRKVGFHYVPGTPVLDDVTLEIAAGDTFAIVGATGSGKTTLVKLLLRFYDPTSGSVHVDGCDVATLRVADLRSAIALVSQDVFLFQGTVRDNILYGRPTATGDEVERARQDRRGPRLHPRAPERLRHHRRRTGPEAVRWAAATHLACPRPRLRRPDPRARRGDFGRRQRDRGRHPAVARPGGPRAHHDRHRPPAVDDPPRRPHRRPRGRQGHPTGQARRAGGCGRAVPHLVVGADGRGGLARNHRTLNDTAAQSFSRLRSKPIDFRCDHLISVGHDRCSSFGGARAPSR